MEFYFGLNVHFIWMCNVVAAISSIIFSSDTSMWPQTRVVAGIALRLISVDLFIQLSPDDSLGSGDTVGQSRSRRPVISDWGLGWIAVLS